MAATARKLPEQLDPSDQHETGRDALLTARQELVEDRLGLLYDLRRLINLHTKHHDLSGFETEEEHLRMLNRALSQQDKNLLSAYTDQLREFEAEIADLDMRISNTPAEFCEPESTRGINDRLMIEALKLEEKPAEPEPEPPAPQSNVTPLRRVLRLPFVWRRQQAQAAIAPVPALPKPAPVEQSIALNDNAVPKIEVAPTVVIEKVPEPQHEPAPEPEPVVVDHDNDNMAMVMNTFGTFTPFEIETFKNTKTLGKSVPSAKVKVTVKPAGASKSQRRVDLETLMECDYIVKAMTRALQLERRGKSQRTLDRERINGISTRVLFKNMEFNLSVVDHGVWLMRNRKSSGNLDFSETVIIPKDFAASRAGNLKTVTVLFDSQDKLNPYQQARRMLESGKSGLEVKLRLIEAVKTNKFGSDFDAAERKAYKTLLVYAVFLEDKWSVVAQRGPRIPSSRVLSVSKSVNGVRKTLSAFSIDGKATLVNEFCERRNVSPKVAERLQSVTSYLLARTIERLFNPRSSYNLGRGLARSPVARCLWWSLSCTYEIQSGLDPFATSKEVKSRIRHLRKTLR